MDTKYSTSDTTFRYAASETAINWLGEAGNKLVEFCISQKDEHEKEKHYEIYNVTGVHFLMGTHEWEREPRATNFKLSNLACTFYLVKTCLGS